MAEVTAKTHEFFDNLKARAVQHIKDGGDVTANADYGCAKEVTISFTKPPPKRYTFADAFEMMKGGTKMKPADYNSPAYVLSDGMWYMNGDCVAKGGVIPWDYLTMDWSEVTP